MREVHERLEEARLRAGYASKGDAATALGVTYSTYAGHENGSSGMRLQVAEQYARKFKVSLDWLATGRGGGPNGSDPAFIELSGIWPLLDSDEKKILIDTARVFTAKKQPIDEQP